MYTVGLARTYRGILYKFFEIGIKYGPPACGRRSILKTQFLRIYTVFPDTSSPDLRYSSNTIWKITISWEAGLVACKIIRFLQAMVTYASTYVLVALSIDR